MRKLLSALLPIFFAISACGAPSTPSDKEAGSAAPTGRAEMALRNDADWPSYGRDDDEQRYSPLTGVNRDTVGRLGVAWTYDLKTNRGVEATPLVIDGVMYVTSAWSIVHAIDAATGRERWVFDPDVPRETGAKACCDVVNRGVAYSNGRVFVGSLDGRLIALDAASGKMIWSVVTVDQNKAYTITGAPRVAKGKVLIGNGGAEYGVRGYISAYDAKTGGLVWRFYTTPNPDKAPDGAASDRAFSERANESWGDEGAWRESGGGGTVWDSIAYDDVNGAVIFGVGNGSPWNQKFRDPSGGDNLFLSSIVSVDAETGAYRWHFQTTPADKWDYTATQSIILADLPLGVDGAKRRVVMQAPKNGFFYVLDAATGEFISGDAFVDLNWADGLTAEGRPIAKPTTNYRTAPSFQTPGPFGAHNWHPMAYSPTARLAFIPAQELPGIYASDPFFGINSALWNTGVGAPPSAPRRISDSQMKTGRALLKGRLLAWDPVSRKIKWRVDYDYPWNGGVLATAAGLVFQGQFNGAFAAYDSETGEKLWTYDLKAGAAAAPIAYEAGGEQYLAIATGWGTGFSLLMGRVLDEPVPAMLGRVVAFKLDGAGDIQNPDLPAVDATAKAVSFGDAEQLTTGGYYYSRMCGMCHGPSARSSGVLPDLRWSHIAADKELWREVVANGLLKDNGMIAFGERLSEAQIEAIRAYVLFEANPETEAAQ